MILLTKEADLGILFHKEMQSLYVFMLKTGRGSCLKIELHDWEKIEVVKIVGQKLILISASGSAIPLISGNLFSILRMFESHKTTISFCHNICEGVILETMEGSREIRL